jgi:antitoxin (DNA-binding transcriptional repressor) of toxin-antitoxin stability system
MEEVNVTQFRRNPAGYPARARRGQRIRIVSRGEIVAELASPSALSDLAKAARARLRGSVLRYDMPLEPAIHPGEWEVNR